jgi:hypothetical protein
MFSFADIDSKPKTVFVDLIPTNTRKKFHQHFTREFFFQKFFAQLFSSYVNFLGYWQKNKSEKVKC